MFKSASGLETTVTHDSHLFAVLRETNYSTRTLTFHSLAGQPCTWGVPLSALEDGLRRHPTLLKWLQAQSAEALPRSCLSSLLLPSKAIPKQDELQQFAVQYMEMRRTIFSSSTGDIGLLDLLETYSCASADVLRMLGIMMCGSPRVLGSVLEDKSSRRGTAGCESSAQELQLESVLRVEMGLLDVLKSEFFHVDPEQVRSMRSLVALKTIYLAHQGRVT